MKKPVKTKLLSGDIIIFGKNIPFEYESYGYTTHYFAHFTGNMAEKLLEQCEMKMSTVYTIGKAESITAKFHNLFDSFYTRDNFFDIDTLSKLGALFVSFGRRIAKSKNADVTGVLKRIRNSLVYINENISKPIQLWELAERENLSISRYHALFKSVMNVSPINYITALKINMACRLLEGTNLSVAEIAKTVGYDDQRYFARVFKKEKGMTPSEYRNI